jgi:hypothetical protein
MATGGKLSSLMLEVDIPVVDEGRTRPAGAAINCLTDEAAIAAGELCLKGQCTRNADGSMRIMLSVGPAREDQDGCVVGFRCNSRSEGKTSVFPFSVRLREICEALSQ